MERDLIITRAKSAAIARDFPLAIKLYKSLLKENPSDLEVLNQLGANYVKFGDDEKALLYYEQIITFSPHDVDAMNSMGAIYRRLKRYNESINILQKALDEDKNTVAVNYNLGFTYKEMGAFEDAIDAFNSVIEENPNDVLAHNHLGSIYYQQKDYSKGIEWFRRGLQVDPNHPVLQYNLAKCYESVKQYAEAVKCYETALKARPGWIEALRDFSELLIKCQKTEEARSIVKRTIELNPDDAKLYMLLGEVFLNEFDYDSAISSFSKADKLENNNVRVLRGLAESYEKGDHPEAALEVMNKVMGISPVSLDTEKQFVHACLSAEEYERAYTHVDSLYKNNGDNDVQILDLYGQYYICVGDDHNAKKYFDQIPTIDPEYKLFLLEAANRYSQIGKIRQAEELAKKYITQKPEDASGYNALGAIYEKQGEKKSANHYFEQGIKVSNNNVYAKNRIKKLGEIPQEIEQESYFDNLPEDDNVDVNIGKSLENIKSSIVEDEDDFDFSSMFDNTLENLKDVSDQIADDKPVREADKFLDEPDPDLDAVFDKYPTLQKNPEQPYPRYPDRKESAVPYETSRQTAPENSYGESENSYEAPEKSVDDNRINPSAEKEIKDAMKDFAQKAEESMQNLNEKAAEFEDKLQKKFDEQSKELEEKAKQLLNQVDENSEKNEIDHTVDVLKENIADKFEKTISEVLNDEEDISEKKEFDFEESDSIINNESEGGETEMIEDETLQDEDFGFADVDDMFETENVVEDSEEKTDENADDEVFGSVDDMFDSEIESEAAVADVAETEEFGSVDDLFEVSVSENEEEKSEGSAEENDEFEEDFGSVEDFVESDEISTEPEIEVETASENDAESVDFGSVDDLFNDEISETEDFGSVDDLFGESEDETESEQIESSDEIEEIEEAEELEELLDEVTDDEIQANVINEDAPFEDIITAAAEIANEETLAEQVDMSKPKDSFDFLDPLVTVRKFLPNIERILQDTDYAHAHSTELELFIKMKQFCEFLPENELNKYRSSKVRMLLDYLIARLSGKPGLLITAESLMKAGLLGEGVMEQVYEKKVEMTYEEKVRSVLEYMKKLTDGLTSKRTAEALCAEADKVLEELELRSL